MSGSAYLMKSRLNKVEIDPTFAPKQRELEAIKACDHIFKRIAERTKMVENPEQLVKIVDSLPTERRY